MLQFSHKSPIRLRLKNHTCNYFNRERSLSCVFLIQQTRIQNHKKDLLALGTRAFVITGHSSSKKNGSLDDVIAVLEEASVPYKVFNEIEENPSVETVVKAAEIGKEFKADFVIGIGGGSPLDASKAIALLIANPEESGDCFYVEKDLKYFLQTFS